MGGKKDAADGKCVIRGGANRERFAVHETREKPAKKKSAAIRRWRRRLFSLVWGYLLLVIIMMFLERSLIFFPTREGDWNPDWFTFEDAHFTAPDGVRLHGWYLEHDNPRAVILFAHGNGGNQSHRAPMLEKLRREMRATVMIFSYRGYGKSEGRPDEPGILADARAARAWLANRAGVAEREIVLMGRSLGGGVAVDLAARDGARALILESTFTSLPDTAAHHYPWLPVRWVMRTRLDSISKIKNYHGPLLQSHGTGDTIVPFELGRHLFDAAPSPEKQFVTLPGLDHNDPQTDVFYQALDAFLESIAARETAAE